LYVVLLFRLGMNDGLFGIKYSNLHV